MENNITSYFLNESKEVEFSLDKENEVLFFVHDDTDVVLNISKFNTKNRIIFKVGNNSSLILKVAVFDSLKEVEIEADVSRGSKFNTIVADFSNENIVFNELINLNEEEANGEVKLATLATKKEYKKYSISFNHKVGKTYSDLSSYGVSKDSSYIKIDGVTHIYENASKSEASQSVRVILFDKESEASGNPILKIDNNDIKAKHGCAIGSLKEEHLYYLLSRGIEEKEARNLLTLGYLLPITKEFDEKTNEKLNEIIGGNF